MSDVKAAYFSYQGQWIDFGTGLPLETDDTEDAVAVVKESPIKLSDIRRPRYPRPYPGSRLS
jgi:hypothetical protein